MSEARITIRNFLPEISPDQIREEILTGLNADRKYIPSKFFYDEKGSGLFEEITRLEEYYPSRTEISILKSASSDLTNIISGKTIVELGSGSCSKISALLEAAPEETPHSINYIPVDFRQSALEGAANCLALRYPGLKVDAVVCDFFHQLHLIPDRSARIICFFGSTLGNLSRQEAREFLIDIGEIMHPGDHFLLGLDMVKERSRLEKAYNDRKGVTAAFNKNILNVVNVLIQTDFNPDMFDHLAFFNKEEMRIEMHLKATAQLVIRSPFFQEDLIISSGETIHTENSHKFTREHISDLAVKSGLQIEQIHTDPGHLFSLVQLRK